MQFPQVAAQVIHHSQVPFQLTHVRRLRHLDDSFNL